MILTNDDGYDTDNMIIDLIGEEDDDMINIFAQRMDEHYRNHILKEPMILDRARGRRTLQDLINGHPEQCYSLIRMTPDLFLKLCDILDKNYGLKGSANVSIQESVAMFLYICAHNSVQRVVRHMLGHSLETISRKVHEVLDALVRMACDTIRPFQDEMDRDHLRLQAYQRYWPYFRGFAGAMDGTHVPVVATGERSMHFFNRHGTRSFNVLAICNFDMVFTYTFIGIPESAHDSKVLSFAQEVDPCFPQPSTGKYFLVDSGYANRRGYLAPYRKPPYHPSDWRNRSPPTNPEEWFNRLHSGLRSVIERTFGVWKMKWRVVREKDKYGMQDRKKLIAATMALHNFIRRSRIRDRDFDALEGNESYRVLPSRQRGQQQEQQRRQQNEANLGSDLDLDSDSEFSDKEEDVIESVAYMKRVRDDVAKHIWHSRR